MRNASESLGSFLALDCKWMRRNPQSPQAREPAHPVELSKGKGGECHVWLSLRSHKRGPAQPPSLLSQRPSTKRLCYFMQLLKQWNSFSSTSGLPVSTWDLLEIGLELLLLISCNNIIIKITHFLTFAQQGGVKLFLLSMIILPQALCFWSYWKFFVVDLIRFLGAIHMHDKCTYVYQVFHFRILCQKIKMV